MQPLCRPSLLPPPNVPVLLHLLRGVMPRCAALLQGEDLNYLGVAGLRVAGGQGVAIIALCQVLLMFGWVAQGHAACAHHRWLRCAGARMFARPQPGLSQSRQRCWAALTRAHRHLERRPEYARACGIEALEPLGLYLPGDKNYPGGLDGMSLDGTGGCRGVAPQAKSAAAPACCIAGRVHAHCCSMLSMQAYVYIVSTARP